MNDWNSSSLVKQICEIKRWEICFFFFFFLSKAVPASSSILFFSTENFKMENNSFTRVIPRISIRKRKRTGYSLFFSFFFNEKKLFVRFNPSLPSSRVIFVEKKDRELQVLRSGANRRGSFLDCTNLTIMFIHICRKIWTSCLYNFFPLNGRWN